MILRLAAAIDPCEAQGLAAAAAQIAELTGVAVERVPLGQGVVTVRSLLPEVARAEPIAVTEQRWRAAIAGEGATILVTVFRHVADPQVREVVLERVRRLNLLAAELSRESGVLIADIDRLFALFGGRLIGCGHRWAGRAAAELAGHCIATAAIAGGLGDALAPERIEALLAPRRRLGDIANQVQDRLERTP